MPTRRVTVEPRTSQEGAARDEAERSLREKLRALALELDREVALAALPEDLPRRERLRGARDGVVRALRELG